MHLRSLVHDLIHRQRDEITEHDVDYGTHAGHGTPHSQSGNTCFRDRCINHTRGPKLFDQSYKHLESSAGFGHIFAHDENTWITTHFLG